MAHALATLNEMYTDSEGEDAGGRSERLASISEDEDERRLSPRRSKAAASEDVSKTAAPTRPAPRASTLVSYLNDTVLSDDEGERDAVTRPEPMEVTSDTESPPSPQPTPTPEKSNVGGGSTVELPPEPVGKCSNEMQQKIAVLAEKMRLRGHDMNQIIQEKKNFRNPSIYEKLIQFCDINEFGTNYQPQIYDPHKWNKSSYYDELAKVQKVEMDKREKERKTSKVEVIMGTAKKAAAANGAAAAAAAALEEERKRKSKWDQVGLPSAARPTPAVGLVNLTASSTGTKSTVISAFGSLPKKPKTLASTSVIKQLPPKDIRAIHSYFLANYNKPLSNNPAELIRNGLLLLKSIPTVRDPVLELLTAVIDRGTLNFMLELENRGKQQPVVNVVVDNKLLDEISKELTSYVSFQPPANLLVFAEWTCNVLGALSTKYSARGRSPVNGSLNDSLQQWLSCRSMRVLLDLNVVCVKKLIANKEAGPAISALLEQCVRNSPHFDWAVAYLGSLFPDVVVSSALLAGLEDYVASRASTTGPKLKSVVGILIHLSGTHEDEIGRAMSDLFKASIDLSIIKDNNDRSMEKNLTVPYLLQLTSLSTALLMPFTKVTVQVLKPDMLERLAGFGSDWKAYAGTRQSLLDLVVHLILSVNEDANLVLSLLLETTLYQNKVVASVAEEILELLIKELEILVRGKTAKVPFLESLLSDIPTILPLLLSPHPLHTSTAVTMLSFIGQQQPSLLPNCAAYVLLRSESDEHLATVVKLSQNYRSSIVLSPAIASALNDVDVEDKTKVWTNITKLLKWESSGTLTSLPILEAVSENLKIISNLLFRETDIKVAHTIAELLRKAVLETKQSPSISTSRSIVQATLSYFYLCLVESDGIDEMKGIKAINSMLKKLCQSCGSTRVYAVRELLESCLFRVPSILFGAPPQETESLVESPIGLKEQNIKQGHTALMGQRHSSVFHAGIIGSGKRKATPICPTSHEDVVHNTTLFLKVLRACVQGETNQETLEGVINISLQLVELISPDVMYNGLPWPEEDFCKVTVERDLYIRRILDTIPIVWHLLAFIAHHRPALCYCSVILRAIVATLIGQWFAASQQGRGPGHNVSLIGTTTRILQIMALGQLLPPPLTALSDVIPKIPPTQVVQILRDCVWNYLRDNVPAPALFNRDANGNMWRDTTTSRPAKQYTETLRLVILDNITSLGPLYYTLFVKGTEDVQETHAISPGMPQEI